MSRKGILTISLDFELYWGVLESKSVAGYKDNLYGTVPAIERMLELFSQYQIHATWATVGFLFLENKEDLLGIAPENKPRYINERLSPYLHIEQNSENIPNEVLFAPWTINRILSTPHQEIATHTLSHFYCLEEGQTAEDFATDLQLALRLASERGIEVKSIVFPRNQINPFYLEICKSLGISSFRGNEPEPYYGHSKSRFGKLASRVLRLVDTYLPVSAEKSYPIEDVNSDSLYNIRSSRFLRPYSKKLAALDWLRVDLMKAEMTHAARHGKIYHLWWHPHNFGTHTSRNIAVLKDLLDHFSSLRSEGTMESLSMSEVSDLVKQKETQIRVEK